MSYDEANGTKPSPEELKRDFEAFQRRHGKSPSPSRNPPLESDVMQNVQKLKQELENPDALPSDLDQLYKIAVVQLEKLLATDIAPTDPKAAVHARNLNTSINILLTFLSRQKKPPLDRLPELLKLIDDNEAELRARFGVHRAA